MDTQTISFDDVAQQQSLIEQGLSKGMEYILVRGKKPIARLQSFHKKQTMHADTTWRVLMELKELGKDINLKGLDLKSLIHEGHRF